MKRSEPRGSADSPLIWAQPMVRVDESKHFVPFTGLGRVSEFVDIVYVTLIERLWFNDAGPIGRHPFLPGDDANTLS